MKNLFKKLTTKNYRGDTIVEVMISMAILAVVVGAAYVSATKSFDASLNSQYRDQGVSYAQQQLELIKQADNGPAAHIGDYEVSAGTPFCINSIDGSRLTGSNCNKSGYTVAVTYCDKPNKPCANNQSVNSFKVTTSWDSATSLPQQSTIFYKPNDSFAGTVVACQTGDPGCTSTLTNPPGVQITATPSNNPAKIGDTVRIDWSTTNIKAGSCTASGSDGFGSIGSVSANQNPGTYTTPPLTSSGNHTYTLSCTDNANNPVSRSAVVTVTAPHAPIVTLTSPSSFVPNHGTQSLTWTVNTDGQPTTCTASGDWSGNKNSAGGNESFFVFSGTTTNVSKNYLLTCTNSTGPGSASAQLTVGPAGLLGHYFQGSNYENYQGAYVDAYANFAWSSMEGNVGGWPDLLHARTNTGDCSHCSIYWSGSIYIDTPGVYSFGAWHDDGARIYLDNNLIMDKWGTQGENWTQSAGYFLTAGWHSVYFDWQNDYTTEYEEASNFQWLPPGAGSFNWIPQNNVSP